MMNTLVKYKFSMPPLCFEPAKLRRVQKMNRSIEETVLKEPLQLTRNGVITYI